MVAVKAVRMEAVTEGATWEEAMLHLAERTVERASQYWVGSR